MSDGELIALIADGNISAFELLYSSTYKKVYAFILSMVKCRPTAEDLMHDTYMRVFEKATSYKDGASVSTWIMTIAKNITYDFFRSSKKVFPLDESLAENNQIHQYNNDDNVMEHFEIEKALAELPGVDAQIAVLYAVCGYKHREIAQILSIPEGTVRRRYREAIKQLADAIGGVADA